MIERGIFTTRADVWAHLFPLEGRLYWYLVRHMRDYLKDCKPVERLGRSKDGSATGQGFLVPKSLPFVRVWLVPEHILSYFPWRNGTAREVGLLWGEQVVDWLISLGYVRPSAFETVRLLGRDEQYEDGDFVMQFRESPIIEVKTELVEGSQNLFVQSREQGHKVHLARTQDGGVLERFVSVDLLEF